MFFFKVLVIFDLVLCSSCDDCLCGSREMKLWIWDFGVFFALRLVFFELVQLIHMMPRIL